MPIPPDPQVEYEGWTTERLARQVAIVILNPGGGPSDDPEESWVSPGMLFFANGVRMRIEEETRDGDVQRLQEAEETHAGAVTLDPLDPATQGCILAMTSGYWAHRQIVKYADDAARRIREDEPIRDDACARLVLIGFLID